VIGEAQIKQASPSTVDDVLQTIPQLRQDSGPNQVTRNTGSVSTGQSTADLRGLGAQRTLVLIDGQRPVPTNAQGTTSTSIIPLGLVSRVDVVTGGASAAYGSDAVVGVVNFILNKKFEGVKATLQGGIASRGDDASWKATIAAGTSFAGGRGHIEGTFDHYFSDGIHNINKRKNGGDQVTNVGGRVLSSPGTTYWNVRFSKASTGGTIFQTGNPLNFMQFQPNGTLQPEDMGTSTVGSPDYQVGGSGGYFLGSSLTSRLRTEQIFGRVSYDLTDTINLHLQVNASEANNRFYDRYDDRFAGTSNGITIFPGGFPLYRNGALATESAASGNAPGPTPIDSMKPRRHRLFPGVQPRVATEPAPTAPTLF